MPAARHSLPGLLLLALTLILAPPTVAQTLAEQMGHPPETKLLILHGDDLGMCRAANDAARKTFAEGLLSSASAMAPCPAFEDIAAWAREHPDHDLGLHLTLTSEWKTHRWGPVAERARVPGLVDPTGHLWKDVPEVLEHAGRREVETEIRAQIRRARALGLEPTHLDSHMGTLYSSAAYFLTFLRVARQEGIVAMIPRPYGRIRADLEKKGQLGLADLLIGLAQKQGFPIVDRLESVEGRGYEARKRWLLQLVNNLRPGVTEVIFHPSIEGEEIRGITHAAQNRIDDYRLLLDPEVRQAIERSGVQLFRWRQINDWWKKRRRR